MAGSAAEERLRAKAERMMRRRWPDARIIHELQLEQGGVRIDLAAAGPEFLALCEIKSERDTLKRLPVQLAKAVEVGDEVWLCAAAKHQAGIEGLASWWDAPAAEREVRLAAARGLGRTRIFYERDAEPEAELVPSLHSYHHGRRPMTDPRARFDMLWAGEMRSALGRHYGGALLPKGMTRGDMQREAIEAMNGREVRRAVCAQLRDRRFPRADAHANLCEPKGEADAQATLV